MSGIFFAFLGGMVTLSVTTLGAAGIFFVKKQISEKWQNGFLGFAGGVMIAASVWGHCFFRGLILRKKTDRLAGLSLQADFCSA